MSEKWHFIPLGTKCTTSAIIDEQFKKREQSLPFDWIDLPIKAIEKFIGLPEHEVEPFVRQYMSQVQLHTQRHPDNTWFPHDVVNLPEQPLDMNEVTEKYIRRHKRLNSLLSSGGKFFFLTVLASADHGTMDDFVGLVDKIHILCGGSDRCVFVTVNLPCYWTIHNHFNFNVPINANDPVFFNWKKWEEDIAITIKQNEYLKSIIENE